MKSIFFRNKYFLLGFFLLLSSIIYFILNTLKTYDIESYKHEIYKESIGSANVYLSTLIKEKQNATTTIGLGLASNDLIIHALKTSQATNHFLKDYSKKLSDNTDFKNVWFQLISKEGVSIERSWTELKGDKISDARIDLQKALFKQKVMSSISVGKFDLSFKTIIPIFDESKHYLGALEVITHFNSISSRLEDKKISSLILADKKYKKQLIYPFTNQFVGEYYVANSEVKKNLLTYFQSIDFDKYLSKLRQNDYFIDPDLNSMISYYPLNDPEKKINLGHIVLIQNIANIGVNDISYIHYIYNIYFLFSLIALALVLYLSVTIDIKNIIGKSYSVDIVVYLVIVYFGLSFGIYKLLYLKYEGDVENFKQTLTYQTLLEYNAVVNKNQEFANLIFDEILNTPKVIQLFKEQKKRGTI